MSLLTTGIVVAVVHSVTATGSPTPVELISAIENVSSDKQQPFSVEFTCDTAAGVPANFRICWQADDRYSVLLLEPMTGSPIALFTDEAFFVFDIVDGIMLTGSGLVPSVSLSSSKGALALKFGFTARTDSAAHLQVDLRSFLAAEHDVRCELSETGAELTHDSPTGKSSVIWEFQLDKVPTLSALRIQNKLGARTVFQLSRLRRDAETEYVAFPRPEALQLPLTKVMAIDVTPQLIGEIPGRLMRSAAGYAAVADPKFRQLPSLPPDVNWPVVQRRAEETLKSWTAILKVYLPSAAESEITSEPLD